MCQIMVPGRIVVTPDDRGGILISTISSESVFQHAQEQLIPFPTPNKKGKRKREIEESNKSVEVKKPMVDVSKRRPEIDVVEKIGVGVTEAQSLFDALSKTQPAKVEEPIPGVKVNKAKEKTPGTKPKKKNK